MERNGDVIVKLNTYVTSDCPLNISYNSDKYKMCKDDIVTPLFCSASDCLSKYMIMGSEYKSVEADVDSEEEIMNLFNARRDYLANMPVIESSIDSIPDCYDSPIWEKPPILQSFSPMKVENNLKPKNSFVNGSKLNIAGGDIDLYKDMSSLNTEVLTNNEEDDINRKLLQDYEAETSSSSSTEELVFSPELKDEQPENIDDTSVGTSELDSNHNFKSHDFDKVPPTSFSPKLPETENCNSNSPTKSDRAMPELIPSLISLDDDDDEEGENSRVSEKKKEQFEVINVADSPEMPTLIPFTSERDEIFEVKTEYISEDEIVKHEDTDSQDIVKQEDTDSRDTAKHEDTDSRDTADNIFQPHVLLRRLSVNSDSRKEDNSDVLSAYVINNCNKPVIDGPEIEEIEGVRFFQFRSKLEMEEFNRKLPKIEADEDMIIPTKTMDITQIKGWRTKFFAPESQFHPCSQEDTNEDDKVTANHLNETENKTDEKKELHSEAPSSETKKSPTSTKCNAEESPEDKKDQYDNSSSDSEEEEKKGRFKEVKDEGNKNPLSAFVSEKLDKYLLNSATLNISLLQKVNPNIIPIAPDAKILSIGKLRKTENLPLPPHLVFKRKSDSSKIEREENDSAESVITLDGSPAPQSPKIITLESSDESEEDIPVASLIKSKRKFPIKRESIKGSKKNEDSEFEASAKRVVLKLTKEGSGVSKGYKVAEISCKKDKSSSMSGDFSPLSGTSSLECSQNVVEVPSNLSSLPIIKKTLFAEKNEKRLVNEFLNNLNMYGTRKDVAMLVQSNQSYFDEGPTLTNKVCAKAVSVLVSNKQYFEEKQKSKKKLKTWQKYLPKKIDKQNMKMKLTKRKTKVERLLNDAESLIPAELGKRSIRLPARYLDSAVLAPGSEWVSPVITLDDSVPVKVKKETVEDTTKTNPENIIILTSQSSSESSPSSPDSSNEDTVVKTEITLPQKRSVKMKKTLIKKKKVKDSNSKLPAAKTEDAKKSQSQTKNNQLAAIESSSSESSDEGKADKAINNKNNGAVAVKKVISGKRKKNEAVKSSESYSSSAEKSLTDEVANKRRRSKEVRAEEEKVSVQEEKVSTVVSDVFLEASPKDCAKSSSFEIIEEIPSTVPLKNKTAYPRDYLMPDCSCKHSSRTALFDCQSKQFICAFCNSMKKLLYPASKKSEPNSLEVRDKNEPCDLIKKPVEEVQTLKFNISVSRKLDSAKSADQKPEVPGLVGAQPSNLTISDISTSIPVSFSNQLLKQEPKVQVVNQNVTTSVPSTNTGNKYYVLLPPPLKTVAKASSVPLLPVRCDLSSSVKNNQPPVLANHSQVVTNSVIFNNKSKPPILIRKSSTGLVPQNISKESSSYVPASNILNRMPENALPHSFSPFSPTSCVNDKTSQVAVTSPNSTLTSNVSSSVASPPVVTAYKVGSNFFICNTKAASAEPQNAIVGNNTVSSTQAKPIEGPIITSVQSVKMDEKIEKLFEDNVPQKENDQSPEKISAYVDSHHNYHKKQRQNRRKSPLVKSNYNDDNSDDDIKKKEEEDVEIDVVSVDDSCNVLVKKKQVKVHESESDVSDEECASIFLSSADKLRAVYSKKTIKERQRRLQIKSGFETLKLSSQLFKRANSCAEILSMANSLIDRQKKQDHTFMLCKKRLKIHNAMLMEKLARLLEGIEDPLLNDRYKMQIIEALALSQNKKSEGCKGWAISSDTNRKKSASDPPDIEMVAEVSKNAAPTEIADEKAQITSPQVHAEKKNSPLIHLKEKSLHQVPAEEKNSPLNVKKKNSSLVAVKGKKSSLVTVKEKNSSLVTVKEKNSSLVTVKEKNSSLVTVKEKNSSLVTVKEKNSPLVTVKEKNSPLVTVKEKNSPLVTVKEKNPPLHDHEKNSKVQIEKKSSQALTKKKCSKSASVVVLKKRPPLIHLKKSSPQPSVEEKCSQVAQTSTMENESTEKDEQDDDSHSFQALSFDDVLTPDESKDGTEIDLGAPKSTNVSPSKQKFEGMKQKVKEALGKKEENSGSDTEELDSDSFNLSGFSDDDFDDVCTRSKDSSLDDDEKENNQKRDNEKKDSEKKTEKAPDKEYPGLIPLFHPKVLRKHVSPSQSPLPPVHAGESSQRAHSRRGPAHSSVAEEIQLDDDEDDDEIKVLNSADDASPGSKKEDSGNLCLAMKKAKVLYGACKVKRVCLKSGKVVYAYTKDEETSPQASSSSASTSKSVFLNEPPALKTNGIVNLSDLAKSTKTPTQKLVPEEIVLSDSSDDETELTGDKTPRTSRGSSSNAERDKNTDDQNEKSSDSPNL